MNQGIFVHDTRTGTTSKIVTTGKEKLDFLFWVFSGRPSGTGDSDEAEEQATAFKALLTGGAQGIFLRPTPTAALRTVLLTGSDARLLDPEAPTGSLVTTLGIERDGFRGCRLALNAGALNATTSESWAGVYIVQSGACTS